MAKLALALLVAAAELYGGGVRAAQPADDWRKDQPGVERRLTPADIPPPKRGTSQEAPDISNHPEVVRAPPGATLKVPPGFSVQRLASGLARPRVIRIAPNGDIFVAESGAGRILVFRPSEARGPAHVFASGLDRPYGIAFYPAGPSPQWVYVGEPGRIVRFPYRSGARVAAGPAQVVIPNVPSAHHWTRDVIVAPDGRTLYYAVGSGSNEAGDMPATPPGGLARFAAAHPIGQAWGHELGRAEVRELDPDGQNVRTDATGLRNCTAMALQPGSGALWCVVNERDGLGDDTPPDYATAVRRGAFYGWPWYYIGDHPDPRLGGRPDLKDKVTVPDLLLQAHSAPLGIAFYDGRQFPADYRGDAFIAMHGSWNRTRRVGYKVVRVHMSGGRPTGWVEDFMTGFILNDREVWGRPVGVAVAADGSLLVSDDGSGSLWRVAWAGGSR
jgi:glucose/arabinose dehydrogenase